MMKILMLNYEFPPIGGGGGHAHRCLLEQFAGRDDLEVDLVTSAPQRGLRTERMAPNVSIHRVGIGKRHLHVWRRGEVVEWLRRARPVYRGLVRSGRYRLVHAFFAFPSGWLCHRTRRKLPYVISLRGSDVPGGNRRLSLDYKLLGPTVFKPIWRHAGAIVACSEGLKARALRFLPAAEIEVIPNGVDLERFHPAESDEGEGATLRLLTVGRLSLTKRLPLLLEAVTRLAAPGGNV
ncbi:MAG: glycosyltransferase, partial [Sedimentisphaerales bacterium]|nr:glycosyltransferase [Sedimentisphaerales bacterium]